MDFSQLGGGIEASLGIMQNDAGGALVLGDDQHEAEGIADFLETVATIIVEVSSLSSNQHSWQNNARFNRTLEREAG
jgi:hypothetical protein